MHLFYFNFAKATNVDKILIELGALLFFPATRPKFWPIHFTYREKDLKNRRLERPHFVGARQKKVVCMKGIYRMRNQHC